MCFCISQTRLGDQSDPWNSVGDELSLPNYIDHRSAYPEFKPCSYCESDMIYADEPDTALYRGMLLNFRRTELQTTKLQVSGNPTKISPLLWMY